MDGSPGWRILVQGEVYSALVVVARITPQQMAQMLLAEHDDMVKAVPSDRADALSQYPFCHGERAGAAGRRTVWGRRLDCAPPWRIITPSPQGPSLKSGL